MCIDNGFLLGVGHNKLLEDCLFIGCRVGNIVKVVVQAIDVGIGRHIGRRGAVVGIEGNFRGGISIIERFFASTCTDTEIATLVGLEVVGVPFHQWFLVS